MVSVALWCWSICCMMNLFRKSFLGSLLTLLTISSNGLAGDAIDVFGSPELKPIHFMSEDGEPVGYWVDILGELSQHTGLQFHMKLKDVRTARNDLLDEPREALLGVVLESAKVIPGYENFTFSKGFGNFNLRFYGRGLDAILLDDTSNIEGTIAVISRQGAFARRWLERHADTSKITFLPVESFDDGLLSVINGKANSFFGSEWATRYAYDKNAKLYAGIVEGPIVYSSQMNFAALNEYSPLIKQINDFAEYAEEEGLLDQIYVRWVQFPPLTPIQWEQRQNEKLTYQRNLVIVVSMALLSLGAAIFAYALNQRKFKDLKLRNNTIRTVNHDVRNAIHDIYQTTQINSSDLGVNRRIYQSALAKLDAILDPEYSKKHKNDVISLAQIHEYILTASHQYKFHNQIFNEQNKSSKILGSAGDLYNIIDNIFENIKSHSDATGISISYHHDVAQNTITLEIGHEGPKFPSKVLQFVNEGDGQSAPTYQSENSTGQGLWVCKLASQANNWKFSIQSAQGVNSFRLLFALSTLDAKPADGEFEKVLRDKINLKHGDKVFICEDSETAAKMLVLQLEKQGIRTVTTATVQDSLYMIKQFKQTEQKPRAALVDVSLPDGSGQIVVKKLVKSRLLKPENIAVVSGYILTATELREFASFGVTKVIQKPFAIEDIIHVGQRDEAN